MATDKKNKFRETPILESTFVEEKPIQDIEEPRPKRKPGSLEGVFKEKKVKAKKVEEETEKEVETPTAKKINLLQRWQQLVAVYQDERTQKTIGLSLILSSTYLCIAFLSYFSTWDVDQDKVMGSLTNLFDPATKVNNWLGKLGALVSHQFMYKWFGVSSFIFVPVLTMYGLQKLLNKSFVKPQAFNAKWLFLMVWSSLTLAFIFHDKLFFLGGGFGYILNQQISNYVGTIGLLALLGFSMLTFLVLFHLSIT